MMTFVMLSMFGCDSGLARYAGAEAEAVELVAGTHGTGEAWGPAPAGAGGALGTGIFAETGTVATGAADTGTAGTGVVDTGAAPQPETGDTLDQVDTADTGDTSADGTGSGPGNGHAHGHD